MVTSGTTAKETAGNDPVELIAPLSGNLPDGAFIFNESGKPGSFTTDGENYARWPDGVKAIGPIREQIKVIRFKRVTDGDNATGLWAFATYGK